VEHYDGEGVDRSFLSRFVAHAMSLPTKIGWQPTEFGLVPCSALLWLMGPNDVGAFRLQSNWNLSELQ